MYAEHKSCGTLADFCFIILQGTKFQFGVTFVAGHCIISEINIH
jgi:hypothetical protein